MRDDREPERGSPVTATTATTANGLRPLVIYAVLALVSGWFSLQVMVHVGRSFPVFNPFQGLNTGFVVRSDRWWRAAYVVAAGLLTFGLRSLGWSPLASNIPVSIANMAECLTFAWITSRIWPGALELRRHRQVRHFLLAALASVVVPAGIVSVGLKLLSAGAPPLVWLWWERLLGDATGIVSILPLVVLAPELARLGRREWAKLAAIGATIVGVSGLDLTGSEIAHVVALYGPLLALMVAVVRLGRPAAALLSPLLVSIVVWHTVTERSIFNHLAFGPFPAAVSAQVFVLSTVAATWLVSATVTERQHRTGELEAARSDLETLNARLTRDKRALTEQQRLTQASEERFRSMFDHTPLGVVLLALDPPDRGRVLMVNPAYCRLFRHRPDELVGTRSLDLWSPEDLEVLSGGNGEATPDQPLIWQRCRRRDDGEEVWVQVTSTVIADESGARLALSQVEDITAEKHAEHELARRALHDELTGLANRHNAMDRLQVALSHLGGQGGVVALAYVDLDRFKDLNETLGHETADEVLVEVGRRLRSILRPTDTASRVGGEEFVILFPDLESTSVAFSLLDRILAVLREPHELASGPITITASVGLAITDRPGTDGEELLRQASTAMYEAKRRGRDRYEIYNETLRSQARHLHETVHLLRLALDNGWFRLLYQPVMDLDTGQMISVEALLRLDHPERGVLGPDEFIDVAEESELIVPIGDWVLTQACGAGARWNRLAPLGVAINLSGRQATSSAVTDKVLRAAAEANLDPTLLRLEVTERVLIEAGDAVVADLRDLTNNHGASLAIDDFGTGYSSLTYLKRFPVDTVKIDRSFVAGAGASLRDSAIIEAITALAEGLHLNLIAEGVETPTQLAHLRRFGCHYAQGYYFAPPRTPEVITQMLEHRAELTAPSGRPLPALGTGSFAWTDQYLLGHRDIDAQHRGCVELVDRLQRAVIGGEGDATLRHLLDLIIERTTEHFAFEESLMAGTRYPGAEVHRHEHQRLLDGVHDLARELDAHTLTITLHIAEFLRDWFVVHLEELDRPLVDHLAQHAQRAPTS